MFNFGNEPSFQDSTFNTMASTITEEEIQNHKNKLNNLITKLINTHNIEEEISINNEIKNETECLSSLLKIKRNELIQKNYYNNQLQQQQQMMQQQIMAAQQQQIMIAQ